MNIIEYFWGDLIQVVHSRKSRTRRLLQRTEKRSISKNRKMSTALAIGNIWKLLYTKYTVYCIQSIERKGDPTFLPAIFIVLLLKLYKLWINTQYKLCSTCSNLKRRCCALTLYHGKLLSASMQFRIHWNTQFKPELLQLLHAIL